MVFGCVLRLNWEVVHDHSGAHLCYARHRQGDGFWVQSTGLLKTGAMVSAPESTGRWQGLPTCFSSEGDCPFDVLSAVFFLVTRMEEYGEVPLDAHERFKASDAWMYRNDCLMRPLVDEWAFTLYRNLADRFHFNELPRRPLAVVSTVDVDSAFAYRGKLPFRTLGGYAKDLLKGDLSNFLRRLRAVNSTQADPFDTYAAITALHEQSDGKLIFFFLVADRSEHNVNLSHRRPMQRELVRALAQRHTVGVHPGYAAASDQAMLLTEIGRLDHMAQQRTSESRFHFLRGRVPEAFRALAEAGIQHDYSIGFADHPGFRLGTCTPVPFYDLGEELQTGLMLHGTHIMDISMMRYLSLTPDAALDYLEPLIARVKTHGGELVLLWHNETWSEQWHWKGWSDFPGRLHERIFAPS